MRISEARLLNFKRFSDLTIRGLPKEAKLVVLMGPNGCGKSSLLDAFSIWYRIRAGTGWNRDVAYYQKDVDKEFKAQESVRLSFHAVEGSRLTAEQVRQVFYFRTAYRNDPDFTMTSLSKQPIPYQSPRFQQFIQDDRTVAANYQRLVSLTLAGVYDKKKDNLTVAELREQLVGIVRKSMKNVFEDLILEGIGNPLERGSFYFERGVVKRFHYKNLSGGEKSAFDLILDLILMRDYYPSAIYCIDEPEAHMHTALQGRLLQELFSLIPEEGQLWITTHSLGMMGKARELALNNRNEVVFLDFDNVDFDHACVLEPVSLDRAIWEKFLSLALDEHRPKLAPDTVLLCEGAKQGRKYKNLDSACYSRIFADKYPDVAFVSAGSQTEIENDQNISLLILKELLSHTKLLRLVDCDDKTEQEVNECLHRGIRVLQRRHLESYLFDDEVLSKLCESTNHADKIDQVLQAKMDALTQSESRGNPRDDVKSAAGDVSVSVKRILNLTQAGNTLDAFMRDTLTPLISEDTKVYRELEACIFGA